MYKLNKKNNMYVYDLTMCGCKILATNIIYKIDSKILLNYNF